MKTIEIPRHSIVMMIGPSNSGKSFLAKRLEREIKEVGKAVKYLSSDNIRRELLSDESLHKHDKKMMGASKQAFDLLHTQLDLYTQYPINTDVVIVDATNLSRTSRAYIENIADKNNYQLIGLVFSYRDFDDYLKYTNENVDRRVIFEQAKNMRTSTLKEIERTKYKSLTMIESIDFTKLIFAYSEVNAGKLVQHENVCFVGDLHGCYDEFLTLLQDKKGITLTEEADGIPAMNYVKEAVDAGQYVHHILVGDIVDKGNPENVAKLVRFLNKNYRFFDIVEGNHDRWNHNYLKGIIKPSADNDKLIDSFFDSVKMFQEDESLRKEFMELYQRMNTYVYNDKFIVTHAPCENKYLGKNDKKSLKKMNTIMYPKRADFENDEDYMDAKEKFFNFLITDSEGIYPLHIFGHVMTKSIFNNRNKWGIDTGCVAGGLLSSIILTKGNKRPFVRKYASVQPKTKELTNMFRTKMNEVEFGSLEIDLQKRLRWMARNGVNFVSGTMSPTEKDTENNDLESLTKGIEYYRNAGVTELIIQPKYMGSRCNVLLHVSDVTKCKAYSRNAFMINDDRLNSEKLLADMYKELQDKYANIFADNNAEYILFDGELLPWNSMGKDLIESDFNLAYKAQDAELNLLEADGFTQMKDQMDAKLSTMSPDDETLKQHELSMLKAWTTFKPEFLELDTTREVLEKYKHQLGLFGADDELHFKPFAILKSRAMDGTEKNWISSDVSNIEMFSSLSDSPFLVLDLEFMNGNVFNLPFEHELEDDEDLLQSFWNYITKQKEMEGVVIKPSIAYVPNVAPYLKCRNKEYLRLTYGFDYDAIPVKTAKLIRSKNTTRKMVTSIKEYELGRAMLNVPMGETETNNPVWLKIACQLISEQEGEKELDPRL